MAGTALLSLALAACGGEKPATLDDLTATEVTFPNGTKVVCETMREDPELQRGLMFRDSLPANRGMLFVYPKMYAHTHWMYQVKFPVDTIWIDDDHRIVEIVANMAPCAGPASACPKYGGKERSRYALEVNAGFAAKNAVTVGERLDF